MELEVLCERTQAAAAEAATTTAAEQAAVAGKMTERAHGQAAGQLEASAAGLPNSADEAPGRAVAAAAPGPGTSPPPVKMPWVRD